MVLVMTWRSVMPGARRVGLSWSLVLLRAVGRRAACARRPEDEEREAVQEYLGCPRCGAEHGQANERGNHDPGGP